MVKNNSCVCVLATNRVVTTSSSLVCIPDRPLPPRRCARKSAKGVRLMYPPEVTVTTISSRSIRSSSSMSPDQSTISVRRGTANCSFTSSNSLRMMPMMRSRDARISKYSRILPANSWSSSVTSLTPICVKRCRRNSRIARACVSDRLYVPSSFIVCVGSSISWMYSAMSCAGQRRVINFSRASAASADPRIVATTSSTFDTATAKPHRT